LIRKLVPSLAVAIGVLAGLVHGQDHPGLIGFRGTFGIVGQPPENSAEAVGFAYERLGLDGVELDMQLSRDGVVVAMHDPSLTRTANVDGVVSDYSFAELEGFDLGLWKGAPVRIPSFEVLLRAEGGRGVFYVDVKEDTGAMIPGLIDAMDRVGYDPHRLHFTPTLLEGARNYKRAFPQSLVSMKTYLLPSEIAADYVTDVVAAGLDGLMFPIYTEGPPAGLVSWVHACGLLLTGFVYHPDDVQGLQALLDAGMDYVLTNQGQLRGKLHWPDAEPVVLTASRNGTAPSRSTLRLAWRGSVHGPVRLERSHDLMRWERVEAGLREWPGGAQCEFGTEDAEAFYRLQPVLRLR
jgi:glycerophosphoryl diester phosphodiesterase